MFITNSWLDMPHVWHDKATIILLTEDDKESIESQFDEIERDVLNDSEGSLSVERKDNILIFSTGSFLVVVRSMEEFENANIKEFPRKHLAFVLSPLMFAIRARDFEQAILAKAHEANNTHRVTTAFVRKPWSLMSAYKTGVRIAKKDGDFELAARMQEHLNKEIIEAYENKTLLPDPAQLGGE